MGRFRGQASPGWLIQSGRRGGNQPGQDTNPHQDENRQAEHEMPHLERFARRAALRIEFSQLDRRVDGYDEQQHGPVEYYGNRAVAARAFCGSHESVLPDNSYPATTSIALTHVKLR